MVNSTLNNDGYRVPKKVLIALPPAMLIQIDYVAQVEHRTRSDLVREALRRYLDQFKRAQMATSTSGDATLASVTRLETAYAMSESQT